MEAIRWISVTVVKLLARILLKVEVAGLERIPASGPVILAINHVNFIDAPLLYALLPRKITGLAKVELWDKPVLGLVASSWRAIPIRRGELDLNAVRLALHALREGKVLGIAPEGTRSHHGRLQRGRPGIVLLALRAPDALILPMAIYGHEYFDRNLRQLRRTEVNLVFGQGFHLNPGSGRITHEMRQQMTNEIMMQIAALLPPQYRGVYSDLTAATERYLRFPVGATSNVRLALNERATLQLPSRPDLPAVEGKGL